MSEKNESTKPKQTKESDINRNAVVGIPVSLTILVPVVIPFSVDELKDYAETDHKFFGLKMIDPTKRVDVATVATKEANQSPAVLNAIDEMIMAVGRHKKKYYESNAYFTPFAGLIEEREI